MAKKQSLTIYVSTLAVERLQGRAAAAEEAAGVPVGVAALAAAMLHRGLGLHVDGSIGDALAPAAGKPAEEPAVMTAERAPSESFAAEMLRRFEAAGSEDRHEAVRAILARFPELRPQASAVETKPAVQPTTRPKAGEPVEAVLAGFKGLRRVEDAGERTQTAVTWLRALMERCGLDVDGARAALYGEPSRARNLRVSELDAAVETVRAE